MGGEGGGAAPPHVGLADCLGGRPKHLHVELKG